MGWMLTRRFEYRDYTPSDARRLSEWLYALVLPPHLPDDGQNVP